MQRTPNNEYSKFILDYFLILTSPTIYINNSLPLGVLGSTMVELEDNVRMGLLIGAVAIVIFVIVNMTGVVFGGEKLFIIDLLGLGDMDAFRTDTGLSTQDYLGLVVAVAMGALYYLSAEDELDWEALLGDDDEEE